MASAILQLVAHVFLYTTLKQYSVRDVLHPRNIPHFATSTTLKIFNSRSIIDDQRTEKMDVGWI